ncbi:MAG: flagellar basal body rod protein FlgC [Cyanobacteria bacterium P01_H01_bin.74]
MDAFDIAASALTAQRLRMDTISSNLANVNTTRKADGSIGAYRRKNVVFAPLLEEKAGFKDDLPDFVGNDTSNSLSFGDSSSSESGHIKGHIRFQEPVSDSLGVSVVQISEDTETPMRMVFDPSHPDADSDGYVEMPNINIVTEMVDMISASRAYEANVTALQSTKGMAQAAIQI